MKSAAGGVVEENEAEGSETEELAVDVFNGVTAVRGAGMSRQAVKHVDEAAMDEDEDEGPAVVISELASLKEVLEEADVVLEVLDARDPLAYHSEQLAQLVTEKEGQKLLLVLNKIGKFSCRCVAGSVLKLDCRLNTSRSRLCMVCATPRSTPNAPFPVSFVVFALSGPYPVERERQSSCRRRDRCRLCSVHPRTMGTRKRR